LSIFARNRERKLSVKMSPAGIERLKREEGSRLTAYRDSVGVLTIGCGHTSNAGPPKVVAGMTITKEQEHEILERDLAHFEKAVGNAVKVPISQAQFDALTSLCFNVGAGAFKKSTVVKRLNKGDHLSAAEAMLFWNKPPEIMNRRKREYAMFVSGIKEA
jgi:GH24 family phage-related lysozyme (muramidase)